MCVSIISFSSKGEIPAAAINTFGALYTEHCIFKVKSIYMISHASTEIKYSYCNCHMAAHFHCIGLISLMQPPVIISCYSVTGYTLSVVNNVSQPVGCGMVGEETSLSIIISSNSTYYNITLSAITNCGTTPSGFISELIRY